MYGCEAWTLRQKTEKINATEMGCWRRIIRHFGRIMRTELDNMESLIIQGKAEGTRLRGRSEMRWIDQITKSTCKTMIALTKEALDRGHWKEVVREFAVATTVTQETTD
jgi:hypothetical protein